MKNAKALARHIRSLDNTGPAGFEGLIRLLLEAWTGQKFVLARSGSQHGHDTAGLTSAGNVMLADGKNYKQNSKLNEQNLGGQFLQAATSFPTLDLWVLVTPKEVASQEVNLLQHAGGDYGIEVLILDDRAHSLGTIEVFCAAYPDVTIPFLIEHGNNVSQNELIQVIEGIRQDSDFPAVKERLERTLAGTDCGLDDTRRRCREWVETSIKTIAQSHASLKQDVAILDSSRVLPLPRAQIFSQLDEWWGSGVADLPVFALLGEEGSGKTWAVFQWLARLPLEEAAIILPLVAGDVTPEAGGLDELLVKAVSKRCNRPEEFVERRLFRWLIEPRKSRRFLVVLDGMNEKPANQWARILSTAADEKWQGRIAVIATSWNGYWQRTLSVSVGHLTQIIETSGYSDSELKDILSTHQLNISNIPSEVLPLVRRPRYCDLALKLLPALGDSGEFTVERLLFEDYKDRQGRKLGMPFDNTAFLELLCVLAKRYKEGHASLTSQDIRGVAPPHDAAFEQIIGGGLIAETGQASQPFKVEHRWLVLGLGILLADHIKDTNGVSIAEYLDAIDQWLEPNPEMGIKADICGAAAYASLKRQYPSLARQALLIRWIGAHNPEVELEKKIAAYVCEYLPDIIAIVEEFWKKKVDNRLAQERLAWALESNLHRISQRTEFVTAIYRWMSLVNRTGQPFDRKREDKEGIQQAQEIAKRAGTELVAGKTIRYAGYDFDVVNDDGLLRLARMALYLLSGTNCVKYAEAFVRWAVSRKIMGRAHELDEVAWVLRLSKERLWPAMEPILRRFDSSGDVIQRQAAYSLLGCVGEREALRLREERLSDVYPLNEFMLQHLRDPCVSTFAWSREDCGRCMDREDVPLRKFIWDISRYATAPSLEAPPSAIRRFEEYARSLPVDEWHATFSTNRGDHGIREAESALARYVPQSFVAHLRHGIRRIGDRNDEGKRQFLICLDDASQIVGVEEQQAIEAVLEKYRRAMEQPDAEREKGLRDRERFAEADGTLTQIMHMTPDGAVDYVLMRPANAQDLLQLGRWVHPISPEKRDMLLAKMDVEQDERSLIRILFILIYNTPQLQPQHEVLLIRLLHSEIDTIRSLALHLVVSSANPACLNHIVTAQDSFQYSHDSWDSGWGAWVLAHHGKTLSISDLARRMPLGHLSDAIEVRGMKLEEVKEFVALLHQLWCEISRPSADDGIKLPAIVAEEKIEHGAPVTWLSQPSEDRTIKFQSASGSWGGRQGDVPVGELKNLFNGGSDQGFAERQHRFWETVEMLRAKKENALWISAFNPRTLAEAAKHCPALVEQWTLRALDGTSDADSLLGRCSGFYQSLCFALASSQPEIGFQLWSQIRNRRSPIRVTNPYTGTDWVSGMPFSVENSAQAEEARQAVLSGCFSDISLLELAGVALGLGHGGWLVSQAQRLVSSDNLSQRAKGIALCCFADVDDETVERLITESEVVGTWVADVVPKLREYHDRNKRAQHWYRKFLDADSQGASWCAFRLFVKCADRRWRKWAEQMESDCQQSPHIDWRIKFRKTMDQNIKRAVEENEKKLKDVFLSIKIHRGELIPFS